MNDTETSSCESSSNSSTFTTVKTIYARAAVVLLAFNFCLTGYVVLNMNKTTQAQIEGLQESSQVVTKPQTQAGTPSPTSGSQTETLGTRDKPQE